MPGPVKYKTLKRRHASYDAGYWRLLRALYCGGKRLLRDEAVMAEAFPQHNAEAANVYQERKKRAHYKRYPGVIIDNLVAGLIEDEVRIGNAEGIYGELLEDATAEGSAECDWNKMMRGQLVDALITGHTWTLVDLPDMGERQFESEAEQEEAGALRPYFVPLAAENVLNWREADDGQIAWLVTCAISHPRHTFDAPSIVRETYYVYTPNAWARYVVEYDEEQTEGGKKKPEDEEIISPDGPARPHKCGAVPVVKLDLSDLWLMDQFESLARSIFNLGSGLEWAILKCLYQQLYEFLGSSSPGLNTPINEHQTDRNRAKREARGPGYVQVRGADDKAAYIGPDTEGYKFAQEQEKHQRDEMHRSAGSLALAADQGAAAALRRSAESKQQDKSFWFVFLMALATRGAEHTRRCFHMAARVRGDEFEPEVEGLEKFDPIVIGEMIDQALTLETISIPSPTFQRLYKADLARRVLGDAATEKDIKAIEKELEKFITAEEFLAPIIPGKNIPRYPAGPGSAEESEAGAEGATPGAKGKPPGVAGG